MLPYSFSIAPFAIVAGATATVWNKYKLQNVVAWCFITIGMGLQTTLHTDSAVRNWVGFEIVAGIGFGLLVILFCTFVIEEYLIHANSSSRQPHFQS